MSQENVEIIRRAFEAFNRGDLDAAMAELAPDFEYLPTGAIPGASETYQGPDGYRRFLGWLLDQFDDARIEVNEMTEVDSRVMASVTLRGRGRQSGAEASWDVWQVYTVRDGKAVRGQGFTAREAALEAARLPE